MAQIRWTRSDYITLGKAVSNFNKKLKQIKNEENKLYLPDPASYQDIKEKTMTRAELNRIIKSLKRFNIEGAENLYTTKAGEKLTEWERGELERQIKIGEKNLQQEIKDFEQTNAQGYSKAMMGSTVYQNLVAQSRNLRTLEERGGYGYKTIKERVKDIGNYDYIYMKATVFRENFMYAFSFLSDLDGYDILLKRLNRFINPINFYNYIKQSNVLMDIFDYYKPRRGSSLWCF